MGDAVTHRPSQLDVGPDTEPDLHLHGGETGGRDLLGFFTEPFGQVIEPLHHHAVPVAGNTLAELSTQQLVERKPRDLACDIPQGDLDTRYY